jgi:hypothetical protein
MYDEFFGYNDFENKPLPGGFHQLEEFTKKKWRVSYSNSEKQRFSKIRRIVYAVKQHAEESDVEVSDALKQFDMFWKSSWVNCNLQRMAEELHRGVIEKIEHTKCVKML